MKTNFELDGQPAARMWISILVSRNVVIDSLALDIFDNGDSASVEGKRDIENVIRDRITSSGTERFRTRARELRSAPTENWIQAERKAIEIVNTMFSEFN